MHGKQTLATLAALSALALSLRRRWADPPGVQHSVVPKHVLRVRHPAPAERAIGQHVSVHDSDLAARLVKAVHDLASRARRLIHARIRQPLGSDDLGESSSERVSQIESVEDLPKLSLADPLDWGACHMSEEIATALARYFNGALRVADLAAILEAQTWDESSRVASQALRLIYEYDHGDWTEHELRDQLRRVVTPRPAGIVLGVGFPGSRWTDESAGITVRRPDPAERLGQTAEQVRWSQSEQRSGVGIPGTSPALDQ